MLYVIEDRESKAVKVGWTGSQNATRRMKELQTGNPHRLRIAGTADGSLFDEQSIHDDLRRWRTYSGGEWFHAKRPVEKLLRMIFPAIDAVFDEFDPGFHILRRQRKKGHVWYIGILSDHRSARGRKTYAVMETLKTGDLGKARREGRKIYGRYVEALRAAM